MSVDVDIHLFVIHGAYVFDAATIALMTFAFLLVFVFAVVGVLLWLFPAIVFVFSAISMQNNLCDVGSVRRKAQRNGVDLLRADVSVSRQEEQSAHGALLTTPNEIFTPTLRSVALKLRWG
jgi:fatty-acid desaturase